MSILAATGVAELLLVLKIAFLVLLYLFVVRVIRTAGREKPQAPSQDSMILTPAAAAKAGLGRGRRDAPSRCSSSSGAARASRRERCSRSTRHRSPSGAAARTTSCSTGDEFASSRHARIEVRGDGVWVQDLESTNGTFVNGSRVAGARRLDAGDVLRVGETDLLVEES